MSEPGALAYSASDTECHNRFQDALTHRGIENVISATVLASAVMISSTSTVSFFFTAQQTVFCA